MGSEGGTTHQRPGHTEETQPSTHTQPYAQAKVTHGAEEPWKPTQGRTDWGTSKQTCMQGSRVSGAGHGPGNTQGGSEAHSTNN